MFGVDLGRSPEQLFSLVILTATDVAVALFKKRAKIVGVHLLYVRRCKYGIGGCKNEDGGEDDRKER
jgi:hypothetical protein